jgi:hypothetical protein
MEYIISENQLKTLLNERKEPPVPIILKLFKVLDEEKKKKKKRSEILEVIEKLAPYMNIPPEYSLYLLELYLLNYNKDGDYSGLTKDNFIDPRKNKGKTTTNPNSRQYTVAQMPFKGSNLEGYWDKDYNGEPYYKVVSFGWYPIFIFKDDKWYEVIGRYSSSTSRQMSNANPVGWSDYLDSEVYGLTADEMKMLKQGISHKEIMKSKLKNLKSIEPKLSKRQKIERVYGGYAEDYNEGANVNIKFKVKSVDIEGEKAIVTIDVYDVVKREGSKGVPTTQNYLKGEIPNITTKYVEDKIISKMSHELKEYVGLRPYWSDEIPKNTQIEFKFNHLKKT